MGAARLQGRGSSQVFLLVASVAARCKGCSRSKLWNKRRIEFSYQKEMEAFGSHSSRQARDRFQQPLEEEDSGKTSTTSAAHPSAGKRV